MQPLSVLMASSYTLYLKTHNYHWNVTGPMFTTLHSLFMTQYTELALAVDEVAERIRRLGAPATVVSPCVDHKKDAARRSSARDRSGR